MMHDYRGVLDLAEDLQGFSGYLDTEDRKQITKKRDVFRAAVRVAVYNLYRTGADYAALRTSVAVDFDRIAEANTHSPGAVAEAREAMLSGIRARARSHPAIHILIRWGPPVVGVAAICLYAYLKMKWR
jgi:hypothetical protein